jgi:hypothetical protein
LTTAHLTIVNAWADTKGTYLCQRLIYSKNAWKFLSLYFLLTAQGGRTMKALRIFALTLAIVSVASAGWAQDQSRKAYKGKKPASGQRMAASVDRSIYGYDYMTGHDRDMYYQRLREAKNSQERNQFLAEHSQRMQERAKAYGVTLPEPTFKRTSGTNR